MRSLLVVALALTPAPLFAQGPWGTIKTWNGTITIEGSEYVDQGGDHYSKINYQATGNFSLTDDMMPDDYHMQWPMVNPEHPPADLEAAYKRWQVHVVGSTEGRFDGEQPGTRVTQTCHGETTEAMRVGLSINPSNDEYILQFETPRVAVTCNDGSSSQSFLRQESFSVTGPRGTPGTKTGSQTSTVLGMTIKVSWSLTPAR